MMNPSEEKLKKMLEEGKITQEQYDELKASLPQDAIYKTETTDEYYEQRDSLWERFLKLPLNLQICTAILVFSTVVLLFPMASSRHGLFPAAIVSVVLNLIIAFGIINLRKWAFWLGMIFGLLAGIMCLAAIPRSFLSLLINVAFVVLLWKSKDYFEENDSSY